MLQVYLWWESYGLFVTFAALGLFFYGVIRAAQGDRQVPRKRFAGLGVQLFALLILVASAAGPDILRSRVEVSEPASAVVVGSVRTVDERNAPQTLVELDGYENMLLVYPEHRKIDAGSTVSFSEISIGGELRRLAP